MSDEKHKSGKDGLLEDGVSYYPADARQMQTYADASDALARFQAPVLIHADNPHERLFVAAFDGTGNDKDKDPNHATNVARINDQIKDGNHSNIQVGYVPGPGTQDNVLARAWDGMTGNTYDARLEQMYDKLVTQAKEWKAKDPDAEIRVADIGFSRGAEQAAGFARLVHERGIVDPDSLRVKVDEQGNKHVEYGRYLVPPGQTPQVEGLFDAVNTGRPEDRDRRPPPSVISGFQVIAEDERRAKFKSDHIIDPGASPDGRFLGVVVAGAHSDVGGSYHRDGLAVRSENLMVDYLNALSDTPYLQKAIEPDDPRRNVVHRSEEGMLIYRLDRKVDRDTPGGYNELLVPSRDVGKVTDPYNAEPRDEALSNRFERQHVSIGAQTQAVRLDQPAPAVALSQTTDDQFEAIYRAAVNKDDAASRQVAQAYAQSPEGQALLAQGRQANRQAQAQEQPQAAPEVPLHAPPPQQPQGPTLRP